MTYEVLAVFPLGSDNGLTAAPLLASSSAISAPSPREAPVTMATLRFSSEDMMLGDG